MTILDTVGRLFGGARAPREECPARHERFFLCDGDRVAVGGEDLLGEMQQTILDQRLLGAAASRIYREVATSVPGVEEYVVIVWWDIIGPHIEVRCRGTFSETVERLNALRRRDPENSTDYTLAYDVTDRVLAAREGGDV